MGAEVGAQYVPVVAVQGCEDDPQQRVGAAVALALQDVPDHVAAELVQGGVQEGGRVGVEGHHPGEQAVLVAEVLEDQRRADAGAFGDVLEGDVGVGVPGEKVTGGPEDGRLGGLRVPAGGRGGGAGSGAHGTHAPSSASSRAPWVRPWARGASSGALSPGMDRAAALAASAMAQAMAKARR